MQIKSIHNEPAQDVIEELERAMELAREGRLRSVSIAGVLTGADHYTAFACDDIFVLISILEHAKFRLLMSGPKVDV